MNPIGIFLIGLAAYEGIQTAIQLDERREVFAQARDYANSIGKPLLVAGAPKFRFNHPCGDVTIDTSPEMASFCDGEIADVRNIPYPDKFFGAVFCSHVLEHLPTMEDACLALDELDRVADRIFVVSPLKSSLMGRLNPGHYLWITPRGDGYIIEQRG